jgi:hypothetical protein
MGGEDPAQNLHVPARDEWPRFRVLGYEQVTSLTSTAPRRVFSSSSPVAEP